MKIIFKILLCIVVILGMTNCGNKNENSDKKLEYNKKLIKCIENELGAYLLTEKDSFIEIPLNEIKDNDDNIAYYKGVHASYNQDNMYVIVALKDKIYDEEVIKEFEKYFYQKFSAYQKYEISSEGILIYIHTDYNNINFDEVNNKCINN